MRSLVEKLALLLEARGWRMTTAESCTGGLIAAALTSRPGASKVFEEGFVTYSNRSKSALLGVPQAFLERHGAVSAQVAQAMAQGALARSNADLALSVTGIAGPDGGTSEKPVGLVYLGCALRGGDLASIENLFQGDRHAIREASTRAALEYGISRLETS